MQLMMQSQVASQFLGNKTFMDQGLLSRCLIVWPASTAGGRLYREINLRRDPDMLRFWDRLRAVLNEPPPLAPGARNELEPRILPLSLDAKRLWISFHDHIETQLREGGPLAVLRGFSNKVPEHAARLAGVLTLFEDARAGYVGLERMEVGIALAQHYLSEAIRVHEAGCADPEIEEAEKLLNWAQGRGGLIDLPSVYQLGPNSIRDAKKARRLAAILEEHGWFIAVPGGAEVRGVHRREVWRLAA